MTEERLRTRLGAFIITLTLGLFGLLTFCFLMGGFYSGELTTIFAVVLPMFTCYSTPAFRHLVNNRYVQDDNSKPVVNSFIVISFGGTSAFALAIFGVILLQAWGGYFSSFEQFEHVLLVVDSAFAVYIGYIIDEVFAHRRSQR
jgi:hypothetical protein